MKTFVPREKMSKRDRKRLDAERRTLWQFSPVTKVVKSSKVYDRKKQSRNHDTYDAGTVFFVLSALSAAGRC